MSVRVKILGERNSGTNFLKDVLEDNFEVSVYPGIEERTRMQNFLLTRAVIPMKIRENMMERMEEKAHFERLSETGGWKHALVTPRFITGFFEPQGCQVICITRHPLAWARSMQANPFHAFGDVPADFDTFINTPWKTRARDELGGATLPSVLVLWREKLRAYLEYAEKYDDFYVLRYEDLLLNPEETFQRLSRFLPLKGKVPQLPTRVTRPFVANEQSSESYLAKARATSFAELFEEQYRPFKEFIGEELLERAGYT